MAVLLLKKIFTLFLWSFYLLCNSCCALTSTETRMFGVTWEKTFVLYQFIPHCCRRVCGFVTTPLQATHHSAKLNLKPSFPSGLLTHCAYSRPFSPGERNQEQVNSVADRFGDDSYSSLAVFLKAKSKHLGATTPTHTHKYILVCKQIFLCRCL